MTEVGVAMRLVRPALLLMLAVTIGATAATAQSSRTIKPAPTGTPASPGFYTNSWALVIGINAYHKVRPTLNYAVADARAMAAALPGLGFPRENIRLLLDGEATKARIESTLYRDFARMGPDDRLLVFFAGHGETLPIRWGEEGYLLPVDADPQALPLTAIPMDDVRRIGQRLKAKHTLFVMDACFSGFALTRDVVPESTTDDYLAAALREPVVQVLTAGRKGERALEEGGHGLFTRRLLDGLRVLPETESRGMVTATRLATWVEERVIRDSRGRMTPQYGRLDGEGQFVFLKSDAQLAAVEPRRERSRPTITKEVVREYGVLSIRARLAGVEVWLDEQKIGETEVGTALVLNNVDVGVYRLKARKPGHKDWQREVTVVANQRADVVIDIEPLRDDTEAQRRWQGGVLLQMQKVGEQKSRCLVEAERARAAREGALRNGKQRDAEFFTRMLKEKTACATYADQELLKLQAVLSYGSLDSTPSDQSLHQRYERELALFFGALQRVNVWFADKDSVKYESFTEQMDALSRDVDGFKTRYARLLAGGPNQKFVETLLEASRALIASAGAWKREAAAEREAARLRAEVDAEAQKPSGDLSVSDRATREQKRQDLSAARELQATARNERVGQWEAAQRLVHQASAIAPSHVGSTASEARPGR